MVPVGACHGMPLGRDAIGEHSIEKAVFCKEKQARHPVLHIFTSRDAFAVET